RPGGSAPARDGHRRRERDRVRLPGAARVHGAGRGARCRAPEGSRGGGGLVARRGHAPAARRAARSCEGARGDTVLATRRSTALPMSHRTRLVLDRALDMLAYRCWPDGCPRGRTCCVGLVVEASRREVRAIDSLMDELCRLLPHLRTGNGYASVFVEDPPGYVIATAERGTCPSLLRTRRHALGAIHPLALRTGRPVTSVKPAACRHWPLLLEVERGRVRLGVQPAAYRMGCVAPRHELPGQPSVRQGFAPEIAELCRRT